MKRFSIVFALLTLFCGAVFAQEAAVLHAVLNGAQVPGGTGDPDGQGWVTLVAAEDGSELAWSAHVKNISLPAQVLLRGRPDDPSLGGDIVIASFTLTSSPAAGTVTTTRGAYLATQPQRIIAVVTNTEFLDGAISGRMSSQGTPGVYTLPVVGRVEGQGGTAFVTDLRLSSVDQDWSTDTATATIEWWPGGTSAAAPAATFVKTVEAGKMLVLNDVMRNELDLEQALGAMRVLSTRPIHVTARIYNDQVAAGKGTFGQFERGVSSDVGKVRYGAISHLHNVPIVSGGFRTNVGWFNHTATPVTILFSAYRPDGTSLGSWAGYIQAGMQQQLSIADIIPAAASVGDFYLLYQLTHGDDATVGPMDFYVYAAVTDNVNGDAIFVLAQPR